MRLRPPKPGRVAFSPATQKYVLWYNMLPVEGGHGVFDAAYYSVAVADAPGGPFETVRVNVTGLAYARLPDAAAVFVDDDGSGAICQHEFNLFLAHAPPLRLGDGEQAAYWARRGLTTIHYHRLVCHYDVRAWYPKSEVVLYALDAPRATLYEEPR